LIGADEGKPIKIQKTCKIFNWLRYQTVKWCEETRNILYTSSTIYRCVFLVNFFVSEETLWCI